MLIDDYSIRGSGWRTVLLVPGGLMTHRSLAHLAAALERDHRVVAITLPATLSSLDSFHRAVEQILDAHGVDAVHLAGHSFGGWLAQQFAAAHPSRTKSLTLLNSFTVSERQARKLRRNAPVARWLLGHAPRRLLDALVRPRVERILLEPLRRARHPELASWQRLVAELIANGTFLDAARCQAALLGFGAASSFTGPTLIIESDDDAAVSIHARAALKARYPHAEVATFEGTGHVTSIVATERVGERMRASFAGPATMATSHENKVAR